MNVFLTGGTGYVGAHLTRALVAAERARVQRVIYTSSTAVHRPFRSVMSEDDALAPADLCVMSKAMGELALAAVAHRSGLVATVIRSARSSAHRPPRMRRSSRTPVSTTSSRGRAAARAGAVVAATLGSGARRSLSKSRAEVP